MSSFFVGDILLTDASCNNNCEFCSASYFDKNKKTSTGINKEPFIYGIINLILDKEKSLRENCLDIQFKTSDTLIFGIYGGEPLVNIHFWEVVSLLKDIFYDKRLIIRFTTNGKLLKSIYKRVLEYEKLGVHFEITISYDTQHYKYFDIFEDNGTKIALNALAKNNNISGVLSVLDKGFNALKIYHNIKNLPSKYISWGFNPRVGYKYDNSIYYTKEVCDNIYVSLCEVFSYVMNLPPREWTSIDFSIYNKYICGANNKVAKEKIGDKRSCELYNNTLCLDLNGNRYGCHHDFEIGRTPIESKTLVRGRLKECDTCEVKYICRSYCPSIETKLLENNCNSLRAYSNTIKRAVLDTLPKDFFERKYGDSYKED